jgi:hypothetical protein
MSITQGALDLPPHLYQDYIHDVEKMAKRYDLYPPNVKTPAPVSHLQIPSPRVESVKDQLPSPAYSIPTTYPRKRSHAADSTSQDSADRLPTPHEPPVDDATPRSQPLRWENDQYTPRWVRYSGSKKEGLCDMCEPNRWLQLKDSAFWYHKQFFHGISSSSGLPFASPEAYRSVWTVVSCGEPGVSVNLMTEGQCHQCQQWIPLFKNKKRFSHYFPSMEHVKDTFLEKVDGLSYSPTLLHEEPLVIMAGRKNDGSVYVPYSVSISAAVLKDITLHESGKMSGVWWRHAHKCHSNLPSR